MAYIVSLVRATRDSPAVALGVSPRGAAALLHAAKAWAWLSGRAFVTPRRGQGDRQACTAPSLADPPRGRARGGHRRRGARRDPRRRPRPPVAAVPVPTLRLAALVAAAAVATALVPLDQPLGMLVVLGVVAAVAVVDVALAPSPRVDAGRARAPRGHEHRAGRGAAVARREPARPVGAGRAGRRARAVAGRAHASGERDRSGARVGDDRDDPRPVAPGPVRPPAGRPANRRAARSARPAGRGRPSRRVAGVPAVPVARRGRAEAASGPHPRGGAPLGAGPGWRHRVRAAARVHRGRRVPPRRLGRHRPGRQADRADVPGRAQPDRHEPASTTVG